MRLTTNSHGFRGPELERHYSSSILFVGDSFTMGYGVIDGEEYPAIIRAAIANCGFTPGLEVINAGIGNTGTGWALKFLHKEAATLKPLTVIVQIHENDFEDNVREGLYKLSESGVLLQSTPPPPGMDRALQYLVESMPGLAYSRLVSLARQVRIPRLNRPNTKDISPHSGANGDGATYEERLTLRLLEEIMQIVKQRGWQLVVVLTDIPERHHSLLTDFLSEHRVVALSIPTKAQRPDLYYKVDGHWNAKGHAFAAERILQALRLPSPWTESDCRRSS